jgi:hypothetical protein
MRFLPILVVLALLVVAVVAARDRRALPRSGGRQLSAPARWRAGHWSGRGRTRVGVERVAVSAAGREEILERREMITIEDAAPDYELRFMDAMAAARVRADVLNAESEA